MVRIIGTLLSFLHSDRFCTVALCVKESLTNETLRAMKKPDGETKW